MKRSREATIDSFARSPRDNTGVCTVLYSLQYIESAI